MKRTWKTPIYQGIMYHDYLISDDGIVVSYKYLESRILKYGYCGSGRYFRCVLMGAFQKKDCMIHKLVYETFGKNKIKGDLQIDHKNNNRYDNRISNLRLVTPKVNNHWNKKKYGII